MPDKPKTAARSPFSAAVRPANVPSARRDPDAAPPPNPSPPAQTAPDGPGPTDPTPDPAPAPSAPEQAAPPAPARPVQPASAVAAHDGGTLASVLTAPRDHDHPLSDGVAALAGLASMATRPKDPMQDWAPDGTRHLRWIGAALRQYAQLTGRKTQDVQRDVMLGVARIPDDVLDAQFYTHYGYPRSQYDPQVYR